ncbi:I78 family peptidase inhibitor [Pigmentiphaga sp.]|uniref:I78 family peptidase inhibitor n=1 Tax=Pigmentiphaga sp. TaxID=1977564 RepID=UPI00128C3239|nr:I78 family peptidase inhibitor [Pigmentiphaga sp.]MPS27951.1 peptidase inhibitor I78 [Alcaligenaceae bacterium SAGV5]MPS51083.1 peptidase inhibitor I78 [Alcaligenaceae bacterium SAGV3]MPT59421.1 peptidase inhibitor I78 [Alcaligenaceae bacterium]
MIRSAFALATLALATGCAAPVPAAAPQPAAQAPQGQCQADAAQSLVGQQLSSVLAEEARKASGAGSARVLRPGQAITMEFNPFRVNVEVNRREVVTAIRCG